MKQKTFYKTLLEFNQFPLKARQCLEDKRLTHTEKRILEGYLFVRNNQNDEALTLLRDLPVSELDFVEAQKKLIIGIALNNLSDFQQSEKYLLEAIRILKELNTPYFEFIGLFNLYFIYSNSNQLSLMEETIAQMDRLQIVEEIQSIRILRCKFDFFSESGRTDQAHEILRQLDTYKSRMAESDIISQLVCEFSFYVKHENFEQCRLILDEMKQYRKFQLTENFNFMKKLLDHLVMNAPIYLYGDDFKSIPLLYNQLKVIHALEDLDRKSAEDTWERLMKSFPESYLPGFKYVGAKCLFSLCLEKHLDSTISKSGLVKPESSSKLESLLRLMESLKKPVSKGELYELIWGEGPSDKDDLKKLARLISRARLENGIDIKSRKGTYYIEEISVRKKIA